MKSGFQVNLNNYVYFKPNERSIRWYREQFPWKTAEEKLEINLTVDDEGYCQMQMWEFMNIFGRHFIMGFGNNLPIADLNIYVEPSK